MSPGDAIEKAIRLSMELGCNMVGVETDQGGDLWELAYTSVMEKLRLQGIFHGRMEPSFSSAKAGAGHGSKAHRALQMKVDYDLGRFRHVRGTHEVLEAALFRFPKKKPYDLVDACYWSWYDLKYNHDLVF